MIQGIIGKKLGMTQLFSDKGDIKAITVIEAGPCTITQVKTALKDGYDAAKLGFGDTKRPKQSQKGKGLSQFKYYRELKVDAAASINTGDKIDVSLFKSGDLVDITGISKGKGFAGTIKRHHFAGGPKTHGQSNRHRAPGSIGATTSPGRVLKGLRMAGHMGTNRVTIRNVEVIDTDVARNRLLIKGAVPGSKYGLLIIRKSTRGK